jgi:hypothetical protein
VENLYNGKPTALGAASGLVAGLVVITPCAGFVAPMSALVDYLPIETQTTARPPLGRDVVNRLALEVDHWVANANLDFGHVWTRNY